jgi:hypothetical protein
MGMTELKFAFGLLGWMALLYSMYLAYQIGL